MRFRLRTDVWLDVASVADAQNAMTRVQNAAVLALDEAATVDPSTATACRADLSPVDEDARRALVADDLGPGISSTLGSSAPDLTNSLEPGTND